MSRLRHPKLVTHYTHMSVSVSHITQVQQFCHPITRSLHLGPQSCLGLGTLPRQVSGYPRPLGTSPRQLSGPIVASFGLRHRDTPKFCVRVIFDIYPSLWNQSKHIPQLNSWLLIWQKRIWTICKGSVYKAGTVCFSVHLEMSFKSSGELAMVVD